MARPRSNNTLKLNDKSEELETIIAEQQEKITELESKIKVLKKQNDRLEQMNYALQHVR